MCQSPHTFSGHREKWSAYTKDEQMPLIPNCCISNPASQICRDGLTKIEAKMINRMKHKTRIVLVVLAALALVISSFGAAAGAKQTIASSREYLHRLPNRGG